MQKKAFVVFVISLICFGFAILGFAHEGEHAEHEEWSPVSAGPVTTWTAPLCGKGKFVVQPFSFYNRTRGTFNSDGHYDSLADEDKKYQFQQQLFMQYGLTDRLEIDGQMVYQKIMYY